MKKILSIIKIIKKRLFIEVTLIIIFFSTGIVIGNFNNSNELEAIKNNERMTYSYQKESISFDNEKNQYYYSLGEGKTFLGNYIWLDDDILQLKDGVLKNKIVFFNNYERQLKIIDLDNRSIEPSILKIYNNQILIRGTLVE